LSHGRELDKREDVQESDSEPVQNRRVLAEIGDGMFITVLLAEAWLTILRLRREQWNIDIN
jgi:hypothetical protein